MLFVDGRYVGGTNELVAVDEQSQFRPMLRCAATGSWRGVVCGGAWFVVCWGCSDRHWLYDGGAAVAANLVPCPRCNEDGRVPCALCR
jgi:glutaredoxin domain-containing cysteine-rich protein 1